MGNRTLVDRALAKAEACEKVGDTTGAEHWLKIADEAEAAYDKMEKTTEKLRSEGKCS